MSKELKVSVIVPFKNSELWLDRCCKSMKKQIGDFQFIFVNDYSTDNGSEIIKSYADEDDRFILIDNLRSPGVSGARNTGLDYVKLDRGSGNWITFVDADDEMVNGSYLMLKNSIAKHERVSMFQMNHQRQYEKTGRIVLKYKNNKGFYYIGDLPIMWYMVWNKFYKKELMEDIYFDENLQFGEDQLFVMECLAKDHKIYCVDGISTIHHFSNKNSLSKIKTKEDLYRHADAIEDFIKRQTNPRVIKMAMDILSEHWGSNVWFKTIGGDDSVV